MKTIEALKKEYDNKELSTIESEAKNFQTSALDAREGFIKILFYLRRTSRFRENTRFKKSTFPQYLSDMFGVSESQYQKEINAFLNFPAETKKLGVGVVSTISSKCGRMNVPRVAKEIDKAQQERKTDLPRENIMEIIQQNTRQPKTKTPKISEKKHLSEVDRLKGIIKELEDENRELKSQNKKLIATVKALKKEPVPSYPNQDYNYPAYSEVNA